MTAATETAFEAGVEAFASLGPLGPPLLDALTPLVAQARDSEAAA